MTFNSEQEKFWAETYANDYIKKNANFDCELGSIGWTKMLAETHGNVGSYLECGCNIGRNIDQINLVLPNARRSIIEISDSAFRYVTAQYAIDRAYKGSILDSDFDDNSFDLVFTMGVLIHVNPGQLMANMAKMYRYSRRYILLGEYFNRTPVAIKYQMESDKLFKRDFGKMFIQNFDVALLDYGFLWGHIYDAAGFDDITWWLFEKNSEANRPRG
jgi:pseudaminic acid biosynthesis-associated methylase